MQSCLADCQHTKEEENLMRQSALESVSYFENGKYEEAMADINKAFELGLDNEDTRQLRARILKKFDMDM